MSTPHDATPDTDTRTADQAPLRDQRPVYTSDTTEDVLTDLQNRLDAARHELTDYKTRVRDRAIHGFHAGDWNLATLNKSLHTLGLPIYEPTYIHQAHQRIDVRFHVAEADRDRALTILHELGNAEMCDAVQAAITRELKRRGETTVTLEADVSIDTESLTRTVTD